MGQADPTDDLLAAAFDAASAAQALIAVRERGLVVHRVNRALRDLSGCGAGACPERAFCRLCGRDRVSVLYTRLRAAQTACWSSTWRGAETGARLAVRVRQLTPGAQGVWLWQGDLVPPARTRWQALVEAVPDQVCITDTRGRIEYLNHTSCAAVPTEVVGTDFCEHMVEEDRERAQACLAAVVQSGRSGSFEAAAIGLDGRRRRLSVRVGPLSSRRPTERLALVVTDITDVRRAQEHLQRSERLASVGTLAAGIAHEINNPVGCMLLAAQAGVEELAEDGDLAYVQRCLQEIADDARRCGRVVQSVLRFARHEPTQKWLNNVNALVERARYLTREALQESDCEVDLRLAPGLPEVSLNPTEFEQVLINLIQNAVDTGGKGTHVEVSTAPGHGVVKIAVADDGPGIAAQDVGRIFDPFFSTRYKVGGTGLGLSVVHGIVQAHGGKIDVQTRPRGGTTFTIELPC